MTDDQRQLLLAAAARYAQDGTGRRIRELANMPQRDMAEHIGITTSGLWRWENGKRRPRGDAAIRWAHQLTKLELITARVAA